MPTVTELARMWRVSHQYVSKLARKGMPLNSLERAADWRDTYARQRPPTDPKQLQFLHVDQDSAKDGRHAKGRVRTTMLLQTCLNRPQPPPDSLEYPLKCSRRIEHATRILFQQALEEGRESKIVAALRNYNAALDGRLKIEQWYHKEVEHRRHLIPMATARQLACKGLKVVVSNLLALPEKVGPLCNPELQTHAIAILRDECRAIIADIEKSWPAEFNDGVLWPSLS